LRFFFATIYNIFTDKKHLNCRQKNIDLFEDAAEIWDGIGTESENQYREQVIAEAETQGKQLNMPAVMLMGNRILLMNSS